MTIIEEESKPGHLLLRKPRIGDGADVHRLITLTEPLDINSLYCYLLICDHFNETSIIAREGESVRGFISAYVHPKKDDTLFIWQVAVDSSMRRQGLAMRMAAGILNRDFAAAIRYIETTVSPSNGASSRFFEALASRLDTVLTKEPYITESMFGRERHEEETLFRIGPVRVEPRS